MILKVCSVYDTKLEEFMQPFFARTTGEAVRMFSDTVANPESMFARHHADYALFSIGEFDTVTGVFTSTGHHSFGPATQWLPREEGR